MFEQASGNAKPAILPVIQHPEATVAAVVAAVAGT